MIVMQTVHFNSNLFFSFDKCNLQYPEELDLMLQVFCLALTKDINLLESKKYDDSVDATDILAMEKEVSKRYLFLAEVLSNHPDLERECILTAFSMNPTAEFFELVCTLAERRLQVKHDQDRANETEHGQMTNTSNGNGIEQEHTENICPKTEFIDALHVITGGTQILESKDYNAEVAPSRLIDELTMLSESVRHDLTCMLSVTRIKNLTWLTPWHKLKEECAQLLENEEKKRIVENTTAAANAKLQYLKLNYDEFKDFKPHEYPGIEKGYEMYVPATSSDESIINSDRDSEETDTAPESKMYKKREARRLSAKKRRQVRRSKKILEQLDDDQEINECRARNIDSEKKKRAIQNMLNVKTTSRPRRPRPKSTRPRKRKVKVEQTDEHNALQMDAVINIKSEEIDIESPALEQPMEPLQQQEIETALAMPSTTNEDVVRQFIVNQNVLQAVNDILGDTPNLISTNGIELLEEIIGTKPEVNELCLEGIFDPETGALKMDATEDENEKCRKKVVQLNNSEREIEIEIERKDNSSFAIEQTMRKRISSGEDESVCAKRWQPNKGVVSAQSGFVDEKTVQEQQQISNDLDRTHNNLSATQICNDSRAEGEKENFFMLESSCSNEIKSELIQNASIDRIANFDSQLIFEPTKIPTEIDEIVLPQLFNHHIILPQVDIPYMASQLLHLPLLPVATSPPTNEKPRNPLLAFRKQKTLPTSPASGSFFSSMSSTMSSPSTSTSFMHISAALRNLDGLDGEDPISVTKCNSPIDHMLISSGTDTMPMSRRDSFSAISFSSSGEQTSDSLLTAASNGPEILTKHCTIALQRIEDNESLSHYLQRDSHDSMNKHHSNEHFFTDDNSNFRQNFLGNSMQPVVVLKLLDANQLLSNKRNLLGEKRTINGCNNEMVTMSTTAAICREIMNVNGNDSNVLREIKQNSQITSANLHLVATSTASSLELHNGTGTPLNDNNNSNANSNNNNNNNHTNRKSNDAENDDDDSIPMSRTFGNIDGNEAIITPHEKIRDAMNLMKKQNDEADDNDDEDDDDEGRKSVEIDNHNGYHNHNNDDDDYNNGKEGKKKSTCGITIEFSVSNGSRNGDGGSGSSDGNGQHQTQHQRCHQQTTHGNCHPPQLEHNVVEADADFSWNYVAAPLATKMRQLTEVCVERIGLSLEHQKVKNKNTISIFKCICICRRQ